MAPKPPKVSTGDFLIAFGPNNTYLARAPENISRSNLWVSSDLSTKLNESKGVNFVVFPPEPETATEHEEADAEREPRDPYASYSKKGHIGDSKLYFPPTDPLPSLKEWLKSRWGTGGLQVVGNAHGAWWGLSSSGNTKWTTNLPRDVRQLLKPYNPHGKVTHLALGIEDAYVVLFEDGHVDWDLKGKYELLDLQLEGCPQGGLIYISLSTYSEDVFFAAFWDATVLYQFPEGVMELDEDFIGLESLRVIVPSDTAKHTGVPVSKRPGAAARAFSVDVFKEVAANVVGNQIESAL